MRSLKKATRCQCLAAFFEQNIYPRVLRNFGVFVTFVTREFVRSAACKSRLPRPAEGAEQDGVELRSLAVFRHACFLVDAGRILDDDRIGTERAPGV